MVRENQKEFKAAGGDNKAECRLGQLKHTMRRQNALGRQRVKPKAANVQVLSAAALHRHPGLKTVLKALQVYRQACSKGTVQTNPANCYNAKQLAWLKC